MLWLRMGSIAGSKTDVYVFIYLLGSNLTSSLEAQTEALKGGLLVRLLGELDLRIRGGLECLPRRLGL